MTKNLASYLFADEAIFLLDSDKENHFRAIEPAHEVNIAPTLIEVEKKNPPKPISIIVSEINVNDTTFLDKVFGSVKQSLLNADIIKSGEINDLGKDVFLFGVNPTLISPNLNLQKYTITNHNQHRVVFSDDLKIIQENSNDEKRKLWNVLKSMYPA